jgi:hypothetical protein
MRFYVSGTVNVGKTLLITRSTKKPRRKENDRF